MDCIAISFIANRTIKSILQFWINEGHKLTLTKCYPTYLSHRHHTPLRILTISATAVNRLFHRVSGFITCW